MIFKSIVYFRKFFCSCYRSIANMVEENWKGVPLTEIYGSQSPWGAPEFPLVIPSYNHTVLYHIPSNGCLAVDKPPKPQIGQDKWDQEYVRMPCSSHSLYPVVNEQSGETHLKKRWRIIEKALSKPITNSKQLADAILSYNTKFKHIWKFRALHKLFTSEYLDEIEIQQFFYVTLPEMAKLALALPKLVQAPIPLLKQNKNHSISLSQQQISSLLANAFFCTFPRRNASKKSSEYSSFPFINFNGLFNSSGSDDVIEKLKCLCYYFRSVCIKVPIGVVTVSRRCVPRGGTKGPGHPKDPAHPEGPTCPIWADSRVPLASLPLHIEPNTNIEDADGLIQVDFANKFLGGGVLNYGCVQEEIRFVTCPELMITMLFTEQLLRNEAVMIIGADRYSAYSGYGGSFQFAGPREECAPRDASRRRRIAVLAVDALPFREPAAQYRQEMIHRELDKAWIGFSFYADEGGGVQHPGVATGNWGCGAFGGCAQLKCLLQGMAAAQTRRPLAYYTFQDTQLRDDIFNVYRMLARHHVTVGQLYKYILRFRSVDVLNADLHSFLYQLILDEEKKRHPTAATNTVIEISESSDSQHIEELSAEMQREFLNRSPDFFSQDDGDISMNKSKSNDKTDKGISECDVEMAESGKIAVNTSLEKTRDPEFAETASEEMTTKIIFEKMSAKTSGKVSTESSSDKVTAEISTSNKFAEKLTSEKIAAGVKSDNIFESPSTSNRPNNELNISNGTSPLGKVNSRIPILRSKDDKIQKKITDYLTKNLY